MRRSSYISMFSAVLLSCLLAVAFGSVSQTARNLQDPVHGIPPAGAEKERDETRGDLLSHVRSSGTASPKAERVDAGDPVSLHSNALHFRHHAGAKFPHQIQLPRYFSGYFEKEKDAAGREAEPKLVDRGGSQVKPLESMRRKRSMDSSLKSLALQDNKGDNGDHPLPEEHGAKVHCWNEQTVFNVVLPASEVAKHFPHECQHPLSCNTTCVAKVPGRDVCARLKSECTVPETQLGTAQNENKQLASLEKTVERHLGELDAKLAQLSLGSNNHKDKLDKLDHNLNSLSNARKEQFSAALVKILDSLDRKAAETKSLFNEKNKQLASFEKNVERRLGEQDAKLAQLSLGSNNQRDKLDKLDHNLNSLSNASKEQFSAALVKILDSLDRKAAEMKSLFNEKNKQLASFEKNVERRLGKLDEKLAQLSLGSNNHKDKLDKLDHNLNSLSNAMKEQFSAALVKILDSLNRKATEMKSFFNEKSQSMMTAISSVLSLIQSDSKTHMWTLKGYAERKAKAVQDGWSWSGSEKVYIGRYLISWGITFKKEGGGVNIHLNFQLHKGSYDEFLQWPFLNEVKLTIIHPVSGEKQEARGKPGTTKSLIGTHYGRPVHASNPGLYFARAKFESRYLERNGYVKDDQLLLKFEVLS